VGVADFGLVSQHYLTDYWPADLDCSGVVGLGDAGILAAHYGHDCSGARTLPVAQELLAQLVQKTRVQLDRESLSFRPNVPNPFRLSTEISYTVPLEGSEVRVRVFDSSGRLVRTLVRGWAEGGVHAIVWDGRSDDGLRVPSGTYFCRMEAGGFQSEQKLTLLK